MRRTSITLRFVVLGFASLLTINAIYIWGCTRWPKTCGSASGPCPNLDACTPDVWMMIKILLVYLGPSVAFGWMGYVYSGRRQPLARWARLIIGLFMLHALLMALFLKGSF